MRFIQKIIVSKLIFLIIPFFLYLVFVFSLSEEDLRGSHSLEIYSSEGNLLREEMSINQEYSDWLPISQFSETLKEMILESEDKRFYWHPGIDPIAILRSFKDNLFSWKVQSGASTIPQQLSRVLWKHDMPKSIFLRKFVEIFYSLTITLRFSKEQILESYLNTVPFGFQTIGFPKASKYYFQKDISLLSKSELAFLVVALRSPGSSEAKINLRYQIFVQKYCLKDCVKSADSIAKSKGRFSNRDTHFLHFTDWMKQLLPEKSGRVNSTLSHSLNLKIYNILVNELNYLSEFKVDQGSVIVLKINPDPKKNPELVTFLGSKNYYNSESGQVKGNLALRNAGSTLKPFVYGLGMEKLGWRPGTMFLDEDRSFRTQEGSHRPKNNDLRYWGQLTLREALSASRNLTAMQAIEKLGVENFYHFLKNAGVSHLKEPPEYYGTGLALGVGEMNLLQLTHLFSALAQEGMMKPIALGTHKSKSLEFGLERKLFSSEIACLLTHVLSDRDTRKRAFGKRSFLDFPFEVALKTGTSKDYKDSWTVGYTNQYIVGVWVGNFSGQPTQRISGSFGAGRIFQQIFRLLHSHSKPQFSCFTQFQKQFLCRISGKNASAVCPVYSEVFLKGEKQTKICNIAHKENEDLFFSEIPEIISPREGEVYALDKSISSKFQKVPLRILVPDSKYGYSYIINNHNPILNRGNLETYIELSSGNHTITLIDENGKKQVVDFQVK
jgi:penicillin-binding protein 1C